jgi:hypothetical protein
MLREVARVLADNLKKRVIVVDTSNEIAGDGDIPHPAIGHARRMQVTTPARQHAVMIEAVENHMPEAIIIDDIGTELEAQAARTIAERGVQLVGTAHGNTLDNLMMNPTLADLIGGIQTVTLGDEEARRRGVAIAVDAVLRGQFLPSEVRWLDESGEIKSEKVLPAAAEKRAGGKLTMGAELPRLYLFGVNRARLEQVAQEMGLRLDVSGSPQGASLFVTSKSYFRRRPQKVKDAEAAGLPIYVLRSNTPHQIRQMLDTLYPTEKVSYLDVALGEAEEAVIQIKNGQEEAVELNPQSAYIRRLQHLIAEKNALASRSTGKDPARHVRIYKGETRD